MEDGSEYIYNFFGKIIPERVNFSLTVPTLHTDVKNLGMNYDIDLSIVNSQISIKVKSKVKVTDDQTLRNIVSDTVRLFTDAYGYVHGFAYDVEITSMTTNYDNTHQVFGVQINEIKADLQNRPYQNIQEFIPLLFTEEFFQLRIALSDLRLAMKYPKDTGVFCYRSLESLMQYFNENDDRGRAWDNLKKNLNIDQSWLDEIRNNAWSARHGKPILLGNELRVDIMRRTWKVVDRFIIFAKNNASQLNIKDYPVLTG